ncbi:MAG: DNA-deoxyinosine glycosylase [Oscillospiraceae bacterium]|nr:DNA-deoxyinosine glycosylase [Oscillospiraceae bacterium]
MEQHNIPPVWDEQSHILILGSFPSVKSREGRFFYHHPQNRFWKVLAAVLEEPLPETVEEKKAMLLRNRIALWDVIASCEIQGSGDSSIRNAVPNDLSVIRAPVAAVFCNGQTAHKLYKKHLQPVTGKEAIPLPSTSPANAARSQAQLTEIWRAALKPALDSFL